MGLGIAFMILASCFMFMSGVFYEAETKLWPVWALASAGATALALYLMGGII